MRPRAAYRHFGLHRLDQSGRFGRQCMRMGYMPDMHSIVDSAKIAPPPRHIKYRGATVYHMLECAGLLSM
jgi:hypothetical protein